MSFEAHERSALPERILMFGTGMLLRSLVAASVDSANRAGVYRGGIVALQSASSTHDRADALNRASGRFTLVERGLEDGSLIERSRVIGSITRALKLGQDQQAIFDLVARPELQIIVSNTSEAGFPTLAAELAPLLRHRLERLPDAPPLLIIPTELVPDNGAVLRQAVEQLLPIPSSVRFCSSLVDRITTAHDLLTIAEPYALWAIEGDPDLLRASFPIADGKRVVFAPDISYYRERKLILLNGAHTAVAPLALGAGMATVHEATEHPIVGRFFHRLLFQELVPGSGLDVEDARRYAEQVWERFRNPRLEHEWRVIATNQAEKLRHRVLPVVERYQARGQLPDGLALCLAATGRRNQWSEQLERDGALACMAAVAA